MTNPVRLLARHARRLAWGIRPLNAEPYATHMPVLTALAATREIRRVVEFGSGRFSTHHFLDRTVYPQLEYLLSFEDDPVWAETVRTEAGNDDRLDLRVVPAVPRSVPTDLSSFDLVFVDDSASAELRVGTVRGVAAASGDAIVVVHDFQLGMLRRTARLFQHSVIVRSLTPQIGVMWNGRSIEHQQVRDLVAQIRHGRSLAVTDTRSWLTHFEG